ncbi:MAG: sulfatase [Dongiaceae bacterium]
MKIYPFVSSLLLAVSLCRFETAASAASAGDRPLNVLMIVVDDLNTDLGCYGKREVKSPNIDRLAARGVRFKRAYCQYPLCNPSRVSFLSGRRPETSGVYGFDKSARAAFPDAVMLPQFFRQKGYFSGGAGKIYHSVRMGDAASWDFYVDGVGEDPQEQTAIKARYGGGDGRPSWHELDGDGSRTRDGLNVRTIARLLAEHATTSKPFFLAVGLHKPHLPWTAPRRFFAMYPRGSVVVPAEPELRDVPAIALQTELSGFAQPDSRAQAIRGYYACVSFADANIGLLLDQLDRHELWRRTIVVLFSDHGFHLGDHGGLWAKQTAFDAATRVPLIFAGAGLPEGLVVESPVELLDLYPTLLELAGFVAPVALEGRSLAPLLRRTSSDAGRTVRSLVFHYDTQANRDVMGRTVITTDWRYTEWDNGSAGRELFWRPDDPAEYRNRVNDAMLAEIRRRAEAVLHAGPSPKPGPANRPRALEPVNPTNAKSKEALR